MKKAYGRTVYSLGEVVREEILPATAKQYGKRIILTRENSPYGNKKWHLEGKRIVDGSELGGWSFYYDTLGEAQDALERYIRDHYEPKY